jgi:hypothetical protein
MPSLALCVHRGRCRRTKSTRQCTLSFVPEDMGHGDLSLKGSDGKVYRLADDPVLGWSKSLRAGIERSGTD